MLLRRLIRISEYYGASPQFVLASGTIANPKELAEKLTGLSFAVISEDGAPHGHKDFIIWNAGSNTHASELKQAADLLAYLARRDIPSIYFTPGRQSAELVAKWADELAATCKIVSYRAGYEPSYRRRLEHALKTGVVKGVAATNALELGIAIGNLRAAILCGYPGSICSMWQQAGRAGRTKEPSLAFLVAREDPLDQYFVRNPEDLFSMPHEHAVVSLDNRYVIENHLLCAGKELPVKAADSIYFGSSLLKRVDVLVTKGRMAETPKGWITPGPTQSINFDAIDEVAVEARIQGKLLETFSRRQAILKVYPGAIFINRGDTYRVKSLTLGEGSMPGTAEVEPGESDCYTKPMSSVSIQITSHLLEKKLSKFRLGLAPVDVEEQVHDYTLMRYDRPIYSKEIDTLKVSLDTVAVWVAVSEDVIRLLKEKCLSADGALHAAEHALIHMIPYLALGGKDDVGGVSTVFDISLHEAAIYIYDGYKGGIGIAEQVYENFFDLATITLKMLSGCSCDDGCPSCVFDRYCGNSNTPLDKKGALLLLELLINEYK